MCTFFKVCSFISSVRINFTPNLPFNKEHLLRHMPVGHLIKFIVTYSNPFWRENGFSGEIVSFDDFKLFDNQSYENNGILCFVKMLRLK